MDVLSLNLWEKFSKTWHNQCSENTRFINDDILMHFLYFNKWNPTKIVRMVSVLSKNTQIDRAVDLQPVDCMVWIESKFCTEKVKVVGIGPYWTWVQRGEPISNFLTCSPLFSIYVEIFSLEPGEQNLYSLQIFNEKGPLMLNTTSTL